MKKILLLLLLSLILTGCQKGFWPFGSSWFSPAENVGFEFVTDNDAVFDLFEDDFGTGTQYDDRFVNDTPSLDLGENDEVANDAGPPISTTKDPAYDEIAKMTPDELRALGTLQIPVLLVSGGELPFPAKQFGDLSGVDKCDHFHYHGASGYSLNLKNIPQPDTPCGFDNNVTQRTVTGQQMVDWFHSRPRNF